MEPIQYIWFGVAVLAIVAAIIYTTLRNRAINQRGVEAEAEVTRISEQESWSDDGGLDVHTYYYVTYRTMSGQTVEAQLGSGKSVDVRFGKRLWDEDLKVGTRVHIRYLPEKPEYVIRIR